jgi:hypothetical protein
LIRQEIVARLFDGNGAPPFVLGCDRWRFPTLVEYCREKLFSGLETPSAYFIEVQ